MTVLAIGKPLLFDRLSTARLPLVPRSFHERAYETSH